MALRYHKKRTYHDFSEELVITALEDIKKNKLSLRKAQEKYGIPKSTLNPRVLAWDTGVSHVRTKCACAFIRAKRGTRL